MSDWGRLQSDNSRCWSGDNEIGEMVIEKFLDLESKLVLNSH